MSYFCWATLMLKDYENAIVANMMKKGYQINSAIPGNQLVSGSKNSAAYIFVISVSKSMKASKQDSISSLILDDFKDALNAAYAKYYSVIVIENGDSTFGHGNIILPENPDSPSKPAME